MLRVATDCSGIEAPIQALKDLKVKFRHIWSCENDKYCIQTIKANYNPEIIYEDITIRDNSKLPKIDAYICGFPCQPFSNLGLKKGTKDKKGIIMFYCIDTIKKTLPKFFILENVPNIVNTNNGNDFKVLINELNKIKKYNIYVDKLNALDYGSPQIRKRIFIIGLRKDVQIKDYETPKHTKKKYIDDILLDKTYYPKSKHKVINDIIKLNKLDDGNDYVIDLGFYSVRKGRYELNITPPFVGMNRIYLSKYNRYLTYQEKLIIQGFPKNFKIVVLKGAIAKQISNTICVNVLRELYKEIFKCIDLNNKK